MYKYLLLAGMLGFTGSALAQDQQGFQVLSTPAPTEAAAGKVEVVEFFWYGCPHCYQFAPLVHDWEKTKAANIDFKLVAPALNPSWKIHAKAYYAAEALGVIEKFHMPMFDAIHKDHKELNDIESISAFAGSLGIDQAQFRDAMNSFAVDSKIRRAGQLARDYRITGVPAMGVAGKYLTNGGMAQSYPNLLRIVDELAAKEANMN